MRLSDITKPELIVFGLEAEDKEDLLRKMVTFLVEKGLMQDADEVVDKLLQREQLMSTGIKKGFAIPHCFTEQLKESLLMIGVLGRAIDYEALDQQPVRFVFLLLGPQKSQGIHLKALARLARLMSKEEFLVTLSQSDSSERFYDALRKEEDKFSLVR